jgi:hypothetical protein
MRADWPIRRASDASRVSQAGEAGDDRVLGMLLEGFSSGPIEVFGTAAGGVQRGRCPARPAAPTPEFPSRSRPEPLAQPRFRKSDLIAATARSICGWGALGLIARLWGSSTCITTSLLAQRIR